MNASKTLIRALKRAALLSAAVVLTACAPTQATNQSKFMSWLPGMKPNKPAASTASTPAPVTNLPRRTSAPSAAPAPNLGTLPNNPAAMSSPPAGNGGNLQAQLAQADQFYRSGALAQAEQAYRVALNMDPRQPIAYYRLGNIAFRKGQYPQAAQYFQRTVELSPRNAKAHYNLGVVYLTLVEKHFKHYRATMPGDADTDKIARLLQDIDAFAAQRGAAGSGDTGSMTHSKDSLDALADALQ